MPNYNSTSRTPFAKGGRVGLYRGSKGTRIGMRSEAGKKADEKFRATKKAERLKKLKEWATETAPYRRKGPVSHTWAGSKKAKGGKV